MQPTNVIRRFGWLVALVVVALPLAPTAPLGQAATVQAQMDWGQMPLYFVANQGQMDGRVAYYVQGSDKTLYFTPEGVTFALASPPSAAAPESRWIAKLDFVDANSVQPVGQAQTEAIVSYFKGLPDEWHTGLPTYSKIVYSDLWPGIDLAYSGTVNRLKYEFVVQPGADPARIRLAYRGATVGVNEVGQLAVSTPTGSFQDDAPIAYQEVDGQRVPVAVVYALQDASIYGFHLGAYDLALPLVIDPAVLVYCGFIGGGASDRGHDIAVDTAGNAYVTGETESNETTFPVAAGPDLTYNGGIYRGDAFVAKVKADGTGLVYCGFIGGSGDDVALGVAVDTAGNAYVTGDTNSSEATFPVTVGPDLSYNGSGDAFVAKVKADGTGLVYAGYIGGSQGETGNSIAVDTVGNAYVTGWTESDEASFPVSIGPDLTHNGGNDAFVAKVKADGTGLVYAGYVGGSGINDGGDGIAVDAGGNAYITGLTDSTEASFPVTVGPDLTYKGGYHDIFVAKVKAGGAELVYCGYIGGDSYDWSGDIAVDAAGNAYVTGQTYSTEATFPVIVGPDLTHNGGGADAFVAKVRADGTGLVYAGYIGGSGDDDDGRSIAVDAAGNAYVVGNTDSTGTSFPVTVGPDLTYNGGATDAFVAKVEADGTGLVYCSYIGGYYTDMGTGVAVDAVGDAYIVGITSSSEGSFPVTIGPDLTFNGGAYDHDAFVARVSYTPSINVYLPLVVRKH
jgi:hypothetical protein